MIKITDNDKFVWYVSDELYDEINREALKMLVEQFSSEKRRIKLNKPIYNKKYGK